MKTAMASIARQPIHLTDIGRELGIDYADAQGERSRRQVTLHEAHGVIEGAIVKIEMLRGYCHLRRAPRDFRVERIGDMWDPATGELVADLWPWLQRSVPNGQGEHTLTAPRSDRRLFRKGGPVRILLLIAGAILLLLGVLNQGQRPLPSWLAAQPTKQAR